MERGVVLVIGMVMLFSSLVVATNHTEGDLEREIDGRYTEDFYTALWVSVGAVLVFILLIYFFFRKPKNRWKKSRQAKKS